MSQDLLERATTTSVSRRTVVKTGAKLAYAVPLVAASFKLSGMSALAVECNCDDDLSTKPLEGGCYTCKPRVATGCDTTGGSDGIQAVDLEPTVDGAGLACKCQSRTCTVNGNTYGQGDIIDDGVCFPVNVAGTDFCDNGGGGGQSL